MATLIYTLSWDRLEYTKRCVEAVKRYTHGDYIHLVLDQGSKDGSAQWLEKNHARSVLLDENIGIVRARNYIHEALPDFDYYVKLDNDCEIQSDGWLDRMISAQEDAEKPRDLMLSLYVRGLVANKGGVGRGLPEGHPQRFEKYNISYSPNIGGICMFYPKRIWDDFGGYDDDRPKHYGDDFELSGKWQELNFYCGYIEDMFCLHMDGTLGQQEKYSEYFDRKDHAGKLNPENYKDYLPDF